MKILVGAAIGVMLVIGSGFTYELTRAGMTENVVDVRIVEVGGHEYIVGTSYVPFKNFPSESEEYRVERDSNVASSKSYSSSNASSICLVHHVGCKACSK